MKKLNLIFIAFFSFIFVGQSLIAQNKSDIWQVRKTKDGKVAVVNTAADNLSYWMNLAEKGIVPYNKDVKTGNAKYLGSKINTVTTDYEDSPDITTHDGDNHTQSENSIFVDPNDSQHVFNSNNSTSWSGGSVGTLYGTSGFYTEDGAETWSGSVDGTGGSNSGDPAGAISLTGRLYSGFIHSNYGQGVAYSSDGGTTWTSVVAAYAPNGGMLDKNHLWVDNSPTSAYSGNVYTAWTDFDGSVSNNDICITYSNNQGVSYATPVEISSGVSAGSHNQGVNIQTGPNGEVYVIWAIYDDWNGKGYEEAIGLAKSLDGGATWQTPTRIIGSLKGIRADEPTGHRVNSFPSMAVDIVSGDIYVVWANYGVPGTNTGDWIGTFMIKSSDQGSTWSAPILVNQSEQTTGNYSYLPWITCDPSTGNLAVVFFDTRNTSGNDVETWVASSLDGGETWEDFRVSDVSFTTKAIPGLAGGYMGDYLGITSLDGMVYPVWSDDRDGIFKAYTSPFSVNLRPKPSDLIAVITDEITGETELTWNFDDVNGTLIEYHVYRDGSQIGTTSSTTYSDMLPSYGIHKYQVSAMHTDGESAKVSAYVKWGKSLITVTPTEIVDTLQPDETAVHNLTVSNPGELDLIFDLKTQITSKKSSPKDYCAASGGGDEYISGVIFGDINNTGTSASGYSDYTAFSTDVTTNETYQLTVNNGNPWDSDDWGVWFDWNHDGDFEDADENPVCVSSEGGSVVSWDITIPDGALPGETTMRIRLKYSGEDCGDPCGTTSYGEVEDYTVNVIGWIMSEVPVDTVHPGESIIIPVTLDATDFLPGIYTANLHFYSNADINDTINVPVTMVVDGLFANSEAIPSTICETESSTLYANVNGASEDITYSWTDGASFSSTEENPVVYPTETTTYTLTAIDGENTLIKYVTVTVNPLVGIPATPTGNQNFFNNETLIEYTTTGATDAASYEWTVDPSSAGTITGTSTTGYFDPSDSYVGDATITVRAINSCGDGQWSDAIDITIEQYVVIIPNEISLEIYPNPTDGKFILSLNSKLEDYLNIQIYNMSGKLVYSDLEHYAIAFNSMIIDLSDQPAGMFIVNVSGKLVNENIKLIIK
ncbi:MAG: T9SS type A sorting domain-containing protein [Bacteroidales bacterium]|nr:T9SS type A sorting domain-containing protein [Bacteroidales bacterium]